MSKLLEMSAYGTFLALGLIWIGIAIHCIGKKISKQEPVNKIIERLNKD